MHPRSFLLVLACCATAAADAPPLVFEVKETPAALVVAGTGRFPHGTRLAGTIRFAGKPLLWRRTYLMQGRFELRLPRKDLPPGLYEVLVRYERRGQHPQLAAALAAFPPRFEARRPWRHGTPLQAVEARLRELALLDRTVAALASQLKELAELGAANTRLIAEGKYEAGEAQRSYDRWLAQLAQAGKPAREHPEVCHHPEELAQAVNLLDKADERARGAIRAELERVKAKVPRRYWPQNKLVRDAKMLDPYLARKLPELAERIATLRKAAEEERKKLAPRKSDAGGR